MDNIKQETLEYTTQTLISLVKMKQKLILIFALFLVVGNAFALDLEPLEAKAKQAKNKHEQLQIYITIIDTLIWHETQLDECKLYIDKARAIAKEYGSHHDKLHLDLLEMRRDFYTNTDRDLLKWINENQQTYLTLSSPLLKAKFLLFSGIVRENRGGGGVYMFFPAQAIYEAELQKNNSDKYLLDTYYRLATYYRYSEIADSAFHFINKGMELRKALDEPVSNIWFTLELLEYYQSQSKYSMGIQLCLEWLDGKQGVISFDEKNAFKDILVVLYLNNSELDKAIATGEELISKIEQHGIENRVQRKIVAHTYLRMGVAHIQKDEFQEALTLLDKVLLYQDNLSIGILNHQVFFRKAEAYIGLKEYKTVEKLVDEFLNISYIDYSNIPIFTYDVFISICFQLYAESDLRPSQRMEKVLLKTINSYLSNNNENNSNVTLASYKLQTLLNIIKSGDKELKASFLKTLDIQETLSHHQNAKTTKDLLIQYQTKEKEQQIQLQQLELARRNTQRNLLIGGFIIVLFTGFIIVWYLRNRTQLLQQDLKNKERIAVQTEELERLYDQKNRLFNNIAHELRTPLTLINAPINRIIKKIENTSEIQQELFTAKRNLNYIQQMVNQILDLSKAQKGELSVTVTYFKISKLLEVLQNDFQSLAQYKEIDFQCTLTTSKDTILLTDGEKLFSVLKNLLSNAFKYTPPRGKVSISVIDLNEDLQITVQDNGAGISEKDLPRIFEYFFQTQEKGKLLDGGTGIGLAICKEYIEAIEGRIHASSELGQGSSFIVTIPKIIEGVEMNTEHHPSFLQYYSSNTQLSLIPQSKKDVSILPKLLIVEDNLEIAQYLSTLLKDTYDLTLKINGQEALNTLETLKPDLIITDLMMPVMNGYELIEALRTSEKWQKIPIITLTALSETAHKIKALRIGVDDYLVKPFNEEELFLRIQYLLENKMKREAFAEEVLNDADNEPSLNNSKELHSIDTEWLEHLETVVKNNIGNVNFTISQLSTELSISSSHLYRKIKRLTGLSPKEYINQIRYTTARQLLENHTYTSVKRVAIEVGFKDGKNFSRNFKKRFGKNPSEYLIYSQYHLKAVE